MYSTRRSFHRWVIACGFGLAITSAVKAESEDSQYAHRKIVSITVCNGDSTGAITAACGAKAYDTERSVLKTGSTSLSINAAGVGTATDEHSSVMPPGYLEDNREYLFFVASGFTGVNSDIGMMVLSGWGPDKYGQWSVEPATSRGYGNYGGAAGQVFLPPYKPGFCPDSKSGAADQDQTFDLNYAAGGSVFKDPTSSSGRLLMIYEGTNDCTGTDSGPKPGKRSYQTLGVATSLDGGRSWPRYASNPSFQSALLPLANPVTPETKQGPRMPFGALGQAVCFGNFCPFGVPANYGRYMVLSPSISLDSLMQDFSKFDRQFGHSEPSAFLDDAHSDEHGDDDREPYIYVVSHYLSGDLAPMQPSSNGRRDDLAVARARLDRSGAPLTFNKWNGVSFSSAGRGGTDAPMLPSTSDGNFVACGDNQSNQGRSDGSISYVEDTHQYLLVFVCTSPGDPAKGVVTPMQFGSAWFYATTDHLRDQSSWSIPKEIEGSYADHSAPVDDSGNKKTGCPLYNGWYPNLMSLSKEPGHLTTTGFVFYLSGSLGGCDNNGGLPPRTYSSRQFTINISPR